jgi:hypothetical protein
MSHQVAAEPKKEQTYTVHLEDLDISVDKAAAATMVALMSGARTVCLERLDVKLTRDAALNLLATLTDALDDKK